MEISELRGGIVAEGAKVAFDTVVAGLSAIDGLALSTHENGFKSELRAERGEEWCFAVVPDADWVAVYIRKPEFRRETLRRRAVTAVFPEARIAKSGEVIVRLSDGEQAARWVDLIRG